MIDMEIEEMIDKEVKMIEILRDSIIISKEIQEIKEIRESKEMSVIRRLKLNRLRILINKNYQNLQKRKKLDLQVWILSLLILKPLKALKVVNRQNKRKLLLTLLERKMEKRLLPQT